MFQRGCVLALTGRLSDAVEMMTSGVMAWRATGSTCWTPLHLSFLADAYAEFGQFDDAWRCVREATAATEASKETWCDADIHRLAGDIVLMSTKPDVAKAQAYFERALAIARQQQARSFELRASMSLARLWRAQGKRGEARDLLASIYDWFTEGFENSRLESGEGAPGGAGVAAASDLAKGPSASTTATALCSSECPIRCYFRAEPPSRSSASSGRLGAVCVRAV